MRVRGLRAAKVFKKVISQLRFMAQISTIQEGQQPKCGTAGTNAILGLSADQHVAKFHRIFSELNHVFALPVQMVLPNHFSAQRSIIIKKTKQLT